jgi:hypothetical protein
MCSGVLDIFSVSTYCDLWYVIRLHTITTCRQLGNNTTCDTEKKDPTSHDVADTLAVLGRRVGKTRHHVVKTNCGRDLKRRHFQLRGQRAAADGKSVDDSTITKAEEDRPGGRQRSRQHNNQPSTEGCSGGVGSNNNGCCDDGGKCNVGSEACEDQRRRLRRRNDVTTR